MYSIIWRYAIDPDFLDEFLRWYGADGEWVKFFKLAEGYQGTDLLRSADNPNQFITIDRWLDQSSYEEFLLLNRAQYLEMDEGCLRLTLDEQLVGRFLTSG